MIPIRRTIEIFAAVSLLCAPAVARADFVCLQERLFETSGGNWAYNAYYLEGNCYADRWDWPSEYSYVSDANLPQDCFIKPCIGVRCVPKAICCARLLSPDVAPKWENGITELDSFYMKIHVWSKCCTYKVKVFKLKLRNGKCLYTAFAIDHFPPDVPCHPVPVITCCRCFCGCNYSIKTLCGIPMVLMTDISPKSN